MTAQEAFQPILDTDESIVESFKPNKFRFIGLGMIADIIKGLFIAIFGLIFFLIASIPGDFTDAETGEPVDSSIFKIIGLVILAFAIITIVIAIVWRLIKYNKVWFCYTTKRIIIRTGFIGADFQTLDFDLIGAMNVRVDLLDKFIHPNTGTLMFASAASPMVVTGRPGGASGYMFVNIQDPYEVYKRIKEYTSSHKDGKANS